MGDALGALYGLHILIVEDNHDAREILSLALEYFGALVRTADSQSEALSYMAQMRPSVVITDMNLGESGDGRRLLSQHASAGTTRRSSRCRPWTSPPRNWRVRASPQYLRKPLDHRPLVDAILAVVRDRTPTGQRQGPHVPSPDLERVQRTCAGSTVQPLRSA